MLFRSKGFKSQASFSLYDIDGSTEVLAERAALTEGAGPNITNFTYIADGVTVQFNIAAMGTYDDVAFVYTRNAGLLHENVEYTVNYNNRTINFNTAPVAGDIVFVSLQNHGGNYLLGEKTYKINTSTSSINLEVADSTIQDILVFVNGERRTEGTAASQFTHTITENLYVVNFNTALSSGDFVHVYLYSQAATYREIHNTYRTFETLETVVYPTDYTINLDRTLKTSGPLHAAIIVTANGRRLRPPQNTYLRGDASTVTFTPDYPADVDGTNIQGNDIEVYLNGVQQFIGIDYTLTAIDGSSIVSVVFTNAPDYLDKIVISNTNNAEFSMVNDAAILINSSVVLNPLSTVRVVDYADHDSSLIRTTVFSGATSTSYSIPHGFDGIGYDAEDSGFDSTESAVITLPRYRLQYVHDSINYIHVSKNGAFQQPNTDFRLINSGTTVEIAAGVSPADVIVITEFTENSQRGTISFRLFKNLLDQVNFYSIWLEDSTKLAADLGIFDTEISVVNAAQCPAPSISGNKPGIVFIEIGRAHV